MTETETTRSLIPADLNEGQREAYVLMRTFIESYGSGMFLLEGYAGTGKAQPLHSKILTPDGWIRMRDIKIGMKVISPDSKSSNVVGVYPQGMRKIYRVHFSDGSSTECCDEHLWSVQNYNARNSGNKWEVLPLSEIRKNLTYCGRINYSVPLVRPVRYKHKQKLIVDPYMLGLLLGDGCISQKTVVRFSSSDEELIESLEESCALLDCRFNEYKSKNNHVEGGIVARTKDGNKVMFALRKLGLQGTNSKTKFVPEVYLRSCVKDRIALIQGLLDTDGHSGKYSLTYSTSSKKLKGGMVDLVRSLGGTATVTSKIPIYNYKGIQRKGHKSYTVSIKLPDNISPFRLKRKASQYVRKTKYGPVRYIKKIEPVGNMECQCIAVNNKSHLYITDNYVVTHNTYLVSKILRYIKDKHRNWKVAVTAPTNKAVKVLLRSGNINDPKVEFLTIHKLLGLKEEITNDGRQIFTRNKYEDCNIESHDVVIIDEVSMLNDDLFKEVEQYSSYVKIIFMGDPAQIPPVGRDDCIPFKEEEREKYGIDRFLLTEIMRQTEGNPILKAGFELREDLNNPGSPIPRRNDLNEDGQGIEFIDFGSDEERQRLKRLFSEFFVCKEFKLDPDHAKVIAWRNVTIRRLNDTIRALIYNSKDLSRIMLGEKLVANKPIMDRYKIMLFTTNDEFEAIDYEVLHRTYATDEDSVRLEYYHATVEYFDLTGRRQKRKIDILHENSAEAFDEVLLSLKKDALSKNGLTAKKAWVRYYDFMRQFADVGYNYAITCHKAQGSTYRNVFVIEDDFDMNRNVFERNRIKYTAYTRPSEKLFIVKQ